MKTMTVTVATLGFPRIGPRRELKFALEQFWSGKSNEQALLEAASGLRTAAWARQKALGADWLPSNDFSLYDHVLDMSMMLGAIPERYGAGDGQAGLSTYFAMARGTSGDGHAGLTASEMTKWFDTNYHFMVPELAAGQKLALNRLKVIDEYREAKAQGYETRPVLLGPVTWLSLAKGRDVDPFDFLDEVLALYAVILGQLGQAGAQWVQIDEPILVTDLDERQRQAFTRAYAKLARCGVKLMLSTYFGGLDDNLGLATGLPIDGLHVDLIRAPHQLDAVLTKAPKSLLLSLGVIDGRNIWRADLETLLDRLERIAGTRDLILAPSCSLLHVPVDLALETKLDAEVKQWLAFAVQKIEELAILKRALNEGRDSVAEDLARYSTAAASRRVSPRIHDPAVATRIAAATPDMRERRSGRVKRQAAQAAVLALPSFPTTTIGSFPQTAEVRHARAEHNRKHLADAAYQQFLREETERAIRWQEDVGLDVLVHGEFERNDMVKFFAERLEGYAATKHGWVQSYGSRCVAPPIIWRDVSRPAPMTVRWSAYAQSLTERPMKGMLTGPVTMLQWSFVRDDLPREEVCRQIALAIRDEVGDLEAAGIPVVQIDEPAFREGLPLRESERAGYMRWAVSCFRLASAGVRDETQVHTHMCYSEFNDIMDAVAAMDADVISIETARSRMELLEAFVDFDYPNGIGPGVWDIHSPRVPGAEEMAALLRRAMERLPAERLWLNPDCGLKTRSWAEVKPAVANLVGAARLLRAELR